MIWRRSSIHVYLPANIIYLCVCNVCIFVMLSLLWSLFFSWNCLHICDYDYGVACVRERDIHKIRHHCRYYSRCDRGRCRHYRRIAWLIATMIIIAMVLMMLLLALSVSPLFVLVFDNSCACCAQWCQWWCALLLCIIVAFAAAIITIIATIDITIAAMIPSTRLITNQCNTRTHIYIYIYIHMCV